MTTIWPQHSILKYHYLDVVQFPRVCGTIVSYILLVEMLTLLYPIQLLYDEFAFIVVYICCTYSKKLLAAVSWNYEKDAFWH